MKTSFIGPYLQIESCQNLFICFKISLWVYHIRQLSSWVFLYVHPGAHMWGCVPPAVGMHEYVFTHTSIVLNPVVSKCFKKELSFQVGHSAAVSSPSLALPEGSAGAQGGSSPGSGAARTVAAPAPGKGALSSRRGRDAEPTDTRVPLGAERSGTSALI